MTAVFAGTKAERGRARDYLQVRVDNERKKESW